MGNGENDVLVGGWSLSGQPLERLLGEPERRAMLAQLGAQPGEASAVTEVRETRLWLRGPSDRLALDGRGAVAALGFVAVDGLDELLDGDYPDGHFALVRFDRAGEALHLSRSVSGGERLYLARLGELVLFATSVRPLLGHPKIARRLNRDVLDEVWMSGRVLFGSATLHAGIDEVLAGQVVDIGDTVRAPRWGRVEALAPAGGSRQDLGRAFRDRLTEAVVKAAGPSRPVCFGLSGGIDSSAIAAALVEAFGADGVQAITYEFDDPVHGTELNYANMVAERLGITRHHVFKLSGETYVNDIPEMVWRSESLVHWPKAFMLQVAREVRRLGYDRYLTGFGIGSHMGFASEVGRALGKVGPRLLMKHWKAARFGHSAWPERMERIHPALEPPHPRIYYLVLRVLQAAGVVRKMRDFFPERLWPLLEHGRDLAEVEPRLSEDSIGRRLQLQMLGHMVSCIDVTRSEKASRELGVYRIAPAHFAGTIPYAYFPMAKRPRLYSKARRLRPGKALLREAYAGILPDEVLYRVKDWGDAVASDDWLRAGRQAMLSALPMFPGDAGRYGEVFGSLIPQWESRTLLATGLALRLWERMFVDLPGVTAPPTWASLRASALRPSLLEAS